MKWLIAKYPVTAAVVVLVSEAAKRSDRFGGFIGKSAILSDRHPAYPNKPCRNHLGSASSPAPTMRSRYTQYSVWSCPSAMK